MSVRYARASAVEAAPMQGETILFNAQANTFCVLNPAAAHIWTKLETPQDVDLLAASICDAFDGVTVDQARRDVAAALERFASLSLVVTAN